MSAALKQRLRRAALDLGFDQVGFAPPDRPAHADAYQAWLDRGWQGEMGYLEREDAVRRRLDPREALPDCGSIIVVSLVYGPDPASGPGSGASGGVVGFDPDPSAIVARYATGRDYHGVFEERLDALAAAVEALAPGSRSKPYVDYGPVLERDHAQRAGLGWIGKNTMLIHPDLGSYLLLGELLTTLKLPPDQPFTADRCGTCTRCIEACPTDAIREARWLDARRCISYLTIELRGPIPEALRPLIGNRVFGCDICQEVCPWNRDAPSPDSSPLAVRPGARVRPETMRAWAAELLELDDEAFRARYQDTPFSRSGREGLLRNLAVGLGNVGGPEARPLLGRMISESPGVVADHALWALGELNTRTGA